MIKKMIAVMLVLCMVLTYAPMTALAAETPVATFELGADGTATHADGSEIKADLTFTVNGYELTFKNWSKVYSGACDAKGNGGIKFGTSKVVGSLTFNVPDNVVKVELLLAK